ncbi:MAG: hypothetical protein OEV94_04520 [Deltaproteobacteria bacterium]|nr:hypothetical protein [Deltaproteobacteria bacterium]
MKQILWMLMLVVSLGSTVLADGGADIGKELKVNVNCTPNKELCNSSIDKELKVTPRIFRATYIYYGVKIGDGDDLTGENSINVYYHVDPNTNTCFIQERNSIAVIPCKSLEAIPTIKAFMDSAAKPGKK